MTGEGHMSLTKGRHYDCPRYGYLSGISLPKRTSAGDTGWRSESGSRGPGLVTFASGRFRDKTPGRHYDRSAGQPAALGRPGTGNARPYLVPSQEARELELSGGVRSLPQVPWWNADRRARDASRAAVPAGTATWNIASAGVPLAFCSWSMIEPKTGPTAGWGMTRSSFAGRFWQWRWHNSGADASRERRRSSPSPARISLCPIRPTRSIICAEPTPRDP